MGSRGRGAMNDELSLGHNHSSVMSVGGRRSTLDYLQYLLRWFRWRALSDEAVVGGHNRGPELLFPLPVFPVRGDRSNRRLPDRRNEIWLPHIPSLATRHFVYCLFNTQSPLGWIWPVDLEWSSSSSIATMQCMTIPLSKIPLSARRAWPQAPRRALDVRTHDQNPSRPNFSAPTFSDETQEQAMARRLKESRKCCR